jgi:hypothetical protein
MTMNAIRTIALESHEPTFVWRRCEPGDLIRRDWEQLTKKRPRETGWPVMSADNSTRENPPPGECERGSGDRGGSKLVKKLWNGNPREIRQKERWEKGLMRGLSTNSPGEKSAFQSVPKM